MRQIFLVTALALVMAGQAVAAEWKKLLEPADLATLLGRDVVVLDIRGQASFREGSIEGALNAPYGTWRGPKENPGEPMSDARLTERLQSLGIEGSDKVAIVYQGKNDTDFGSAARVYWTLKSAGLTKIAILNGGLEAWQDAGQTLSTRFGSAEPSAEVFHLANDWMVTRAGVKDVVAGKTDAQIIDARPFAFLKGEKKHPAAQAAGTLSGAANVEHSTWFDAEDPRKVRTVTDVIRLAREAGVEDGKSRPIASFCNTGHWAATNWFVLSELAGIDNVKLYPESMVGWTRAGEAAVKVE